MNNRMENIKKIEMTLFGKYHNSSMDATFNYMNNYLEEKYFGDKGLEWNTSKAIEEFNEIKEAVEQLQQEIDTKSVLQESVHHVIEEIGDWLLATSSMIGYPEYDIRLYNMFIKEIRDIITHINDSLLVSFGSDVITVDSVFESNKFKLEEYSSAYKTYEELQSDNILTNDPLVRIIRMLHTKKEIKSPNKKDKIIKEIRRMRFAIIENKKWGV